MQLFTRFLLLLVKLIAWYHNKLRAYHTDSQQRIGAQLQQQQDQLATAQNENEKLSAVVASGNNIDGMSKSEVIAELKQRGELRDDEAGGVHDVPGVQGQS